MVIPTWIPCGLPPHPPTQAILPLVWHSMQTPHTSTHGPSHHARKPVMPSSYKEVGDLVPWSSNIEHSSLMQASIRKHTYYVDKLRAISTDSFRGMHSTNIATTSPCIACLISTKYFIHLAYKFILWILKVSSSG